MKLGFRQASSSHSSAAFVCPTTLAISGEAHRDGQGYHVGRVPVVYRRSELTAAGFVRFIAELGGAAAQLSRKLFR